jgi:hypothetical protein
MSRPLKSAELPHIDSALLNLWGSNFGDPISSQQSIQSLHVTTLNNLNSSIALWWWRWLMRVRPARGLGIGGMVLIIPVVLLLTGRL